MTDLHDKYDELLDEIECLKTMRAALIGEMNARRDALLKFVDRDFTYISGFVAEGQISRADIEALRRDAARAAPFPVD